jgi:hypothetical protein
MPGPQLSYYNIDSACHCEEGQVYSPACVSSGFIFDPIWSIVGDSILKRIALFRLEQFHTEPCSDEG